MSPYWSQERLFGHWGPTNRVVFRVLIFVVVASLCLMGYFIWQQATYNDNLRTYLDQARKNRIASQALQQKQIDAARAAARDVACFTVKYAESLNPKAKDDPFIKALSARYDCAHYRVPPTFPPVLGHGSTSPPGGSSSTPAPAPHTSAIPSRNHTPGASPSPSASPRPRQSTTTQVVALPGPTRTRTATRTVTATTTPPLLPILKALPVPSLVCNVVAALAGRC